MNRIEAASVYGNTILVYGKQPHDYDFAQRVAGWANVNFEVEVTNNNYSLRKINPRTGCIVWTRQYKTWNGFLRQLKKYIIEDYFGEE